MKTFKAKLNNFQYGAYPFTNIKQYIVREEVIDRSHRIVYLEIPDEVLSQVAFVNRNIAGNYYNKHIIEEVK